MALGTRTPSEVGDSVCLVVHRSFCRRGMKLGDLSRFTGMEATNRAVRTAQVRYCFLRDCSLPSHNFQHQSSCLIHSSCCVKIDEHHGQGRIPGQQTPWRIPGQQTRIQREGIHTRGPGESPETRHPRDLRFVRGRSREEVSTGGDGFDPSLLLRIPTSDDATPDGAG